MCQNLSKSDRKQAETIAQQEGLAYEGTLADLDAVKEANKPSQGQKRKKSASSGNLQSFCDRGSFPRGKEEDQRTAAALHRDVQCRL